MIIKRLEKKKNQKRKSTTLDAGLFIFFIVSIILLILGINIYRETIISPKYLFVAISIGTIIVAILLLIITKNCLNALLILCLAICIGGGISYFTILFLNSELGEKELVTETFDIQSTGNLAKGRKAKCRQPYAIIDVFGVEKQLMFYCNYEKTIGV